MNDYDEFKIWYTHKAPDESEVTMVDMAAMAWQAARAASPKVPQDGYAEGWTDERRAMLNGALETKVPQGVEEWLVGCEHCATIENNVLAFNMASNLRAYLSGMVIVPVEQINKALHGLEHLKADIQARSKMQEDYQEGVVMVGAGAWHGLRRAILMLAAAKREATNNG